MSHRRAHRRSSSWRVRAIATFSAFLAAIAIGSVAPPNPANAAPAIDVSTWDVATIGLPNGGIAYDATRDVVLVAVGPAVPSLGNHLIELDPKTGAMGRGVFVGSDPRTVVVADDGSRAYVSLFGATAIVEVDLATFTVAQRIELGTDDGYGPRHAVHLAVQPGHPEVLAASQPPGTCGYCVTGLTIFDDGVPRASSTSHAPARLAWSDDPALLLGLGESNPRSLIRYSVDETGVHQLSPNLVLSTSTTDLEFADGGIYTSSGRRVDAGTMVYSGSYEASGPLAVDVDRNAIYFLDDGELSRHNLADTEVEWRIAVPDIEPRDLVDAGRMLVGGGPDELLLIGPGATGDDFALPPTVPRLARFGMLTMIDLDVRHLAAAPDGGHVYATTSASSPTHAESLVELDATDGTISRSVALGDDPDDLAVSADGSTVLVGHAGGPVLHEIDIGSFEVVQPIPLAPDERATDIASRPGAAGGFAVMLDDSTNYGYPVGVILVDDGVVLPARRWTYADAITFGNDPAVLYLSTANSPPSIEAIAVDDAGIGGVLRRVRELGDTMMRWSDGSLAVSDGTVIGTPDLNLVGRVSSSGQHLTAPLLDRTFMLEGNIIHEYERSTFSFVADSPIPGGAVRDAVRAGSALMIATDAGDVLHLPLGASILALPTPPRFVWTTAGRGALDVSWTLPPSAGTGAVIDVVATAEPGGATCTSSTTACRIDGLVGGVPHTVTVRARSAAGMSLPSQPSRPSTPTACGTVGGGPFTDVDAVHLFCSPIEWANASLVVRGFPDGSFKPTAPTSRQALAAELFRIAGDTAFIPPTTPTYSDVGANHPFRRPIEWLAAEGLARGYANGTFAPTLPITRQSLAALLHRLAGAPPSPPPASPTFTDVPSDHPFAPEIEWLASVELANGFSDGTFHPGDIVSRQSAAALLQRFVALDVL